MSRRQQPPDHREPEAVAGLRQRLDRRDGLNVNDEIKRLGRMRHPQLKTEARKTGLSAERVAAAATSDELRRAILLKRLERAGVGVPLG